MIDAGVQRERAQVMILYLAGEYLQDEGSSIMSMYNIQPTGTENIYRLSSRHRSPPFSADLLLNTASVH